MNLLGTNLVQASENMRQVHNRVSVLVHLVEDIVAEQLDDVPVSRLRPTWLTGKSKTEQHVEWSTTKARTLAAH